MKSLNFIELIVQTLITVNLNPTIVKAGLNTNINDPNIFLVCFAVIFFPQAITADTGYDFLHIFHQNYRKSWLTFKCKCSKIENALVITVIFV